MRANGRMATIRNLLDQDPICLEIVRYLIRHQEAADTARGIAEWWIRRDVATTSQALARLHQHGVVRSHIVQGSTSVYAFTKNPLLRESLRHHVQGLVSTTAVPH